MSFYVNQIRRGTDPKTYMEEVTLVPTYVHSKNPFGEESKYFRDFALTPVVKVTTNNGEEKLEASKFEAGKTYYLRFSIRKIPQYFYSADNSLNEYNANYAQADILNLSILLQRDRENTENSINPDQTADQVEQQYGNIQKIGTCTVPMKPYEQYEYDEDTGEIIIENGEPKTIKKINSDYSSFSFIFTPRSDKNYIVFKILRTTYDAIEKDAEDGQQGRTWLLDQYTYNGHQPDPEESKIVVVGRTDNKILEQKIYIPGYDRRVIYDTSFSTDLGFHGECSLLNNIKQEDFAWSKMGYQGRPGSLIVINNEPIRVGRSGIFEINNGLGIQSVKLAAPLGSLDVNNIDAFLLDYAYTE